MGQLRAGWLVGLLGLVHAGAAPLGAQTVLVRVTGAEASQPLNGALVQLIAAGRSTSTRLTNEQGRAMFLGVTEGVYRVRVEMIGRTSAEADAHVDGAGPVSIELTLATTAIALEGLEVAAGERCRVRPGEGLVVAQVWDEARKALEAAAYVQREELYRFETVTYERDLELETMRIGREETSRGGGRSTPFASAPAGSLVSEGFVQSTPNGDVYQAPDAAVLLSDAFLDSHCFRVILGSGDAEGLVGLRFEPVQANREIVDISGALWLDLEQWQVKWLEYAYEGLPPDLRSGDIGGHVEFQRMPTGAWIVAEWWIRMPRVVRRIGSPRLTLGGLRQVGGLVTDIRTGGRSIGTSRTGGIEGIVWDSLGIHAVAGASVSVVGSSQTVYTDSEGSFGITNLPPGLYEVAVETRDLAAWHFSPAPASREVFGGEMARLEYRLPSIADAIASHCPDAGSEESVEQGVLLGSVQSATTERAISGVTVSVHWIRARMINARTDAAEVTGWEDVGVERRTDEEGFFTFCSVPLEQQLTLRATMDGFQPAADTLRILPADLGARRSIRMTPVSRRR